MSNKLPEAKGSARTPLGPILVYLPTSGGLLQSLFQDTSKCKLGITKQKFKLKKLLVFICTAPPTSKYEFHGKVIFIRCSLQHQSDIAIILNV